MLSAYRINPRIRAYGKARIDITLRARDENDFQKMWRAPLNSFPFTSPVGWKHCIEYKVEDFAAEAGFFVDVLGMPVYSFSPSYAQFTSPDQEYHFSFSTVRDGEAPTHPESLRLAFRIEFFYETLDELEHRGIEFENRPQRNKPHSSGHQATFRTPNGIRIDLIGVVEPGYEVGEDDLEPELDSEEQQELEEMERIRQKYMTAGSSAWDEETDEAESLDAEDEPESDDDLDVSSPVEMQIDMFAEETEEDASEENLPEASIRSSHRYLVDERELEQPAKTLRPAPNTRLNRSRMNTGKESMLPWQSTLKPPGASRSSRKDTGRTESLQNEKPVRELAYQEIEDDFSSTDE